MTVRESTRTWPDLLGTLLDGQDLEVSDTAWAMEQVMTGAATSVQLAGLLVALRAKGETAAEVLGMAEAMRALALPVDVPGHTVDVVGTGGDRAGTVNISTMAAVVAAAAGARVVKHGNRAASSASGSADVLEALGVRLDLTPDQVAQVGAELGITFCFAQRFHPALRHAAPARRELGVPTVLNLLGPLTNPARPAALAVGVAFPDRAPLLARVFARRGDSALVFHGEDGLDELTVTTTSRVWSVHGGEVRESVFDPRDVGIGLVPADALRGGDAHHNARVARAVFAGQGGPVRDAVLLSAAAALTALAAVSDPEVARRPLAERIGGELDRAAAAIDSGTATDLIGRWAEISAKLAAA
ncbi:Anthranilate phosphoribosyltransferase [Streptomyces sp. enrichment culture]|uniref:anthranilate phosphoribosyltransferase n=1 Tax=Streptomyces sp. enrichment culture TaxID=1795815 RepID=UPI003F576097